MQKELTNLRNELLRISLPPGCWCLNWNQDRTHEPLCEILRKAFVDIDSPLAWLPNEDQGCGNPLMDCRAFGPTNDDDFLYGWQFGFAAGAKGPVWLNDHEPECAHETTPGEQDE